MYRSSDRGFTLLEVLAALLIAAMALTYLIQSETMSLKTAQITHDLRDATRFAHTKLQELLIGTEGSAAGTIEEREGWTWLAKRETVPDTFGAERIILTVEYTSGGIHRTVELEQLTR